MKKYILSLIICIFILIMCINIGSVYVALPDALYITMHKLFGITLPARIEPMTVSIFWNIRVPRALVSFFVGGSLAVSGAVMQSLLQNPLASSYTMGVSSGSAVGAALIIISGIQTFALRSILLPLTGFIFALLTVFFVILFSSRIDRNIHSYTIILIGMVISLFVSAMLTLIAALFPDHSQQIYFWMMGSFSARNWSHVLIIIPVSIIVTFIIMLFSRELDIMTFGDDQAMSIGVNTRHKKILLIMLTALLTGVSVAFTGTIGFIDLVAPHAVRRIFGARHKAVIPMSFLFGGAFMSVMDLIARTLLSPREIPVGAVTALLGAPFFIILFFKKRDTK
ncbi:MAG: iron ABC transporter permease [Lachnospiraceae bacterium]|nr:iron ABC transporter permease [Lachnospiraceae bacterium]